MRASTRHLRTSGRLGVASLLVRRRWWPRSVAARANATEKRREQSRMSPTDARRAVKTAAGLKESLPATRDALESGADQSPAMPSLLAGTAPRTAPAPTATVPVDETELLPKAAEQSPDQFAKTLAPVGERTSPRPGQPSELRSPAQSTKACRCGKTPTRVCTSSHGEFDPVTGARISTQLAATTDRLWRDEHGKNPGSGPVERSSNAARMPSRQLVCGPAVSRRRRRGPPKRPRRQADGQPEDRP